MSKVAARRDRWVKLGEAGEYAGVCMRTLRRWIASGRLPAGKTGPEGRYRVRLSDVDRVLLGER